MKYRIMITARRRSLKVAERCVYLEALSPEEAEEKAKALIKVIYPQCDIFDAFNTVSTGE
jgi:hypothetical protein